MGKQFENKFSWTIKNFSSLQSRLICSDHFVSGGCKWLLKAYPKGNVIVDHFALYLVVADYASLPCGWRRNAKVRLTIVNQHPGKLSHVQESQDWFDQKALSCGNEAMFPLDELTAKDRGFLVNNVVKIVAEVDVLEVIGKSNVLEETSNVVKTIDVNGFQVLPSQVEYVNSLFEKHPDIASKFHTQNPLLRTAYLNVLLSLIEILCKSPEDLSNSDLADTYSSLRDLTKAGFKLDWLEKKLKAVGESRVQESEEELKKMKRKCSDMDALLEFLR